MVNKHGWHKVTSYWIGPEGYESPVSQLLAIQGLPTSLLIHKAKLQWQGHPSERPLADDISGLIAGSPLVVDVHRGTLAEEPSAEELYAQVVRLGAILLEHKTEILPAGELLLRYVIFKTHTEAAQARFSSRHQFVGFVFKKYADQLEALVAEMKVVLPCLEDRVERIEAYAIARAAACSRCCRALHEAEVQYLSLFEAGFALCEACESTPGTGEGSARLAHPYSMYRLHPGAEHLDDVCYSGENFGKDFEYPCEPEHLRHSCYCALPGADECQGRIIGVRWKCAHCKDYDLCNSCHSKWTTAPTDRMLAEPSKSGHFAWHVLIKKPFP
jgi:hypothetical protein